MRTLAVSATALLIAVSLVGATAAPLPQPAFVRLDAGPLTVVFAQCGEIGTSTDVIVTMSGNTLVAQKIPGTLRPGDIVCVRRLTNDKSLDAWRQQIVNGNFTQARRNGTLTLVATNGTEILRWTLADVWPSKLVVDLPDEIVALTANSVVHSGKIQPQISWPSPSGIAYGTPLGSAQLNATSAIPGTFTYDPPAGSILGAGVHTITASFTPTDATNFANATATVQLTITKAELSVVAADASKTYGAPLPPFTYTLSGFVNGEASSVVTGAAQLTSPATAGSDVGLYPITPSAGTLTAVNYAFSFVPGTLTITRAPLEARAHDAVRPYGSPNPPFTGTLTGVVNNDAITATYGTTATVNSNAGTYAIVPALADPGSRLHNYDVQLINGALTIEKVVLDVAGNNLSIFFLDPLPPLTVTYSGFVLDEGPSVLSGAPLITTLATPTSEPGTYPIVVTTGTLAATNYIFRFVDGVLTIAGARTALDRAAGLTAPLVAASHPGDREKLERSHQWLAEASAVGKWQGENRPLRTDGQAIFALMRDAAIKLDDVRASNKSGLAPSTLDPMVDLIRKAARIVAFVAIADAQKGGAPSRTVQQASDDYARAESLAAAGRLPSAINEYRNAWARFN